VQIRGGGENGGAGTRARWLTRNKMEARCSWWLMEMTARMEEDGGGARSCCGGDVAVGASRWPAARLVARVAAAMVMEGKLGLGFHV